MAWLTDSKKKIKDTFIHFHMIHERDRQTNTHTHKHTHRHRMTA